MNKDFEILKEDLRAIGLKAGDTVLIHSSYKSMGGLEGGIQTLVDAVLSVLGDRGTLVVPTLTYTTVTAANPVFNYLETPSCVGAISEFVRNMSGAIRSVHPTHSCAAIGYRAEEYTSTHYLDRTPAGENSPFTKLMYSGARILMLGSDIAYNTSFHAIEEIADLPYVLTGEPIEHTLILPDRTYTAHYRRHTIVPNGYMQRYNRIERILAPEYMPRGNIHGASSVLFDGAKMLECALGILKDDPYFFVEKKIEA